METRGIVAEWDAVAGRLKVQWRDQGQFLQSPRPGKDARLAENAIDLIELDVGGGFGMRGEFYPEDFLIPFAARKSIGR